MDTVDTDKHFNPPPDAVCGEHGYRRPCFGCQREALERKWEQEWEAARG